MSERESITPTRERGKNVGVEPGGRPLDRHGLRQALDPAINTSEENRWLAFNRYFDDSLEDMIDANVEIYTVLSLP